MTDRDIQSVLRRLKPCPVPSGSFDALSAATSELEKYFLPKRPNPRHELELFSFWGQLLSGPIDFTIPQFAPDSPGEFEAESVGPVSRAAGSRGCGHATRGFGRLERSTNWSGSYVTPLFPKRFVQVMGSWRVPAPAVPHPVPGGDIASRTEFRSSTWIGLDGHRTYPTASMPQIGSSQFVRDNSSGVEADTRAWVQWWVMGRPEYHVPIYITNFDVEAGDEILASVTVLLTEDVLFHLKNQRTGQLVTFIMISPGHVHPLGTTAEWIHERPTERGGTRLYGLPRCEDVTFDHCLAVSKDEGGTAALSDLRLGRLIRMYEYFDDPRRTVFVSVPEIMSDSSVRIQYQADERTESRVA